MDNEKLIELVRGYPFLYDLSDRKYSDNQKKDDAWMEIAEKLKVNEKDCKKSWGLLRDAFRRAIKKQKETKSGQAGGSIKKWKYQDEMSFLLPHFKERATLCTISLNQVEEIDDGENSSVDDSETSVTIPEIGAAQKSSSGNQEHVFEATQCQPSTSKTKRISESPKKRSPMLKRTKSIRTKTPQSTCHATPSASLMDFILKNKTKSNDDVQQFFDCIATTVQKFPPRDRAIAKAEVFKLISQMELEIIGRDSLNSNSTTGYPTSSASSVTPMPEPSPNNDFCVLSPPMPTSGSVQVEAVPEYSVQHYFSCYNPK